MVITHCIPVQKDNWTRALNAYICQWLSHVCDLSLDKSCKRVHRAPCVSGSLEFLARTQFLIFQDDIYFCEIEIFLEQTLNFFTATVIFCIAIHTDVCLFDGQQKSWASRWRWAWVMQVVEAPRHISGRSRTKMTYGELWTASSFLRSDCIKYKQ
jgi:hypothetical protein